MRPFRLLFLILLLTLQSAWADPTATSRWQTDTLVLRNGTTYRGVVLEETDRGVRFQIIAQNPGRPTVTLTCYFLTREIQKMVKISPEERQQLQEKLTHIQPENQKARIESIELQQIRWLNRDNAGFRYQSDFFSLESDAPAEIVRRAAVRLEEVFTAYLRFLPPRTKGGNPVLIRIHQSHKNYLASLPNLANFQNPAFYDPATNRIVCGSDLKRLGDDLALSRVQAEELLQEIQQQEMFVRRLYGKKPELGRHLQPLIARRKRVYDTIVQNDRTFENATQQLFRTLYHEAFHAYLAQFVFPTAGGKTGVPRWLNEGMAQIFETAVFEAGELRIGHIDPIRLRDARNSLQDKKLPTIPQILGAESKAFVLSHETANRGASQIYLGSWAFATFCLFQLEILSAPNWEEFIKTGAEKNENWVQQFEQLAGMKLSEVEILFHSWLKEVKPDGSWPNMTMMKK
ncbi:MAG: DUF1570 domain-containing protein [Zavarzinella sp.]